MKFIEITDQVKAGVQTGNPAVVDQVVKALVDQEITTRADIIRKGVECFKKASKTLSDIRPKSAGFDASGIALPPIFTTEQMGQKKKSQDLVDRLDAALTKAIAECDYANLLKAVESNETA